MKWARLVKMLTVLMRFCVGAVFAYSGFVKGVDPWGTIYKVQEYIAAMGLTVPGTAIVAGAFALIAVEFVTGIFIIFGCYRRISVWVAAAIMAVMLPLTAWISMFDPVPDCGCFGDAWVLSNTATFVKNIILSAAVVWLVIYNRRLRPYITPSIQWIELVASGLFILTVSLYGYNYQPAIDFRPYKVGQQMVANDTEDEQEAQYAFIYSKDGKEQQFDIEEIPDESEGWTFVRRQLVKAAQAPADGRLLTVYDEDGNDMTEDVLQAPAKRMLLLYPTLSRFNIASTYQINALYDYCMRNGIAFDAIMSATPKQLAYFRDVAMPSYSIYTAEDTSIKEVARGCPSIVYIEDGIVKWKTQLRDIDTTSLEENPAVETLATDYSPLLPWAISILLLLSMLLVTSSLFAIPLRKAYDSTRIAEFLSKFKKETKQETK